MMTTSEQAPEPVVRIRDLAFRYPGETLDILRIPVLDVMGGGLTALTGPSGAGKSTLIELLAGTLREPYSGSVQVLGIEWSSLTRDGARQRQLRRIGFVPQDYGLLPGRTVRQILEQDLRDAGTAREQIERRISSALGQVGLLDFLHRTVTGMSGGQRQRVAVARMLARDVDLVIADEPTANLDPSLVRETVGLFRQLTAHSSVIIVTHDARVATLCDRTVVLQSTAALETPPKAPATSNRMRMRLFAGFSAACLLAAAAAAIFVHFTGASPVVRPIELPTGPFRETVAARLLRLSPGFALVDLDRGILNPASRGVRPTDSLEYVSASTARLGFALLPVPGEAVLLSAVRSPRSAVTPSSCLHVLGRHRRPEALTSLRPGLKACALSRAGDIAGLRVVAYSPLHGRLSLAVSIWRPVRHDRVTKLPRAFRADEIPIPHHVIVSYAAISLDPGRSGIDLDSGMAHAVARPKDSVGYVRLRGPNGNFALVPAPGSTGVLSGSDAPLHPFTAAGCVTELETNLAGRLGDDLLTQGHSVCVRTAAGNVSRIDVAQFRPGTGALRVTIRTWGYVR